MDREQAPLVDAPERNDRRADGCTDRRIEERTGVRDTPALLAAAAHPARPGADPARPAGASGAAQRWDASRCVTAIEALGALRARLLAHEQALGEAITAVAPAHRASARNLVHYLALRREDLRELQHWLAGIGLSSLGRAESHVLANLEQVLAILHRLADRPVPSWTNYAPVDLEGGQRLLERQADTLLGPSVPTRRVRIMVTLPTEAARDAALVRALVAAGMDVARINCAHDDAAAWAAMAANVRAAAAAAGRGVRVLMDLAGPKLRTGPLPPGPAVLRLKPARDALGRVIAPARLGLRPAGSASAVAGAQAHLGVGPRWLAALAPGDEIRLDDARGARRRLRVAHRDSGGVLAECSHTAYLVPETRLAHRRAGRGHHAALQATRACDLPCTPGRLRLCTGDRLLLTRPGEDHTPAHGALARIPCTLPEVFGQVRTGERIFFDDGRFGGVIRSAAADALVIEITQAPAEGGWLAADRGINLPDSDLMLPALTAKDDEDLAAVARLADCVGLSFVSRPSDIEALRARLAALGAGELGLILKIETRRAFERLPELLLAAMRGPAAGVMIARGDLAVECGFERLAEVQEEILWAAEAAHLPVVWATQVLETMAKTGLPSRAEVTDAAMGERAECVMLNKGPHVIEAILALDDILRRMQSHQTKKRALLRALAAWSSPPP